MTATLAPAAKLLVLSAVVGGCSALPGQTAFVGGLVDDPDGVVIDATIGLVDPGDPNLHDLGQGLQPGGTASSVSGVRVELVTPAAVCSDRPDVRVGAKGDTVEVRLVQPEEGEPCRNGQLYHVTIILEREFSVISVG